jgi:predicted nucleic acid-binding protein
VRLWSSGSGRLSTQVLHEFYVTTTRKLVPGLSRQEARDDIRDLLAWGPVPLDGALIQGAWSVQDEHSVSFWDSLIVAAAIRSESQVLLTEDLQDGYEFGPTRVVNPFTHDPGEHVT